MRVVFTVTCSWYFLRFLNLTIIQTYVCGSTNEWNPFITKPINGIYRLFIVNFSLVGLGAFKLKYLLRRGDGSEACLALPASRCPRHHHERAASHTAWRTDKHLGRKSNYMYAKDIFYIRKYIFLEILIIVPDYYVQAHNDSAVGAQKFNVANINYFALLLTHF